MPNAMTLETPKPTLPLSAEQALPRYLRIIMMVEKGFSRAEIAQAEGRQGKPLSRQQVSRIFKRIKYWQDKGILPLPKPTQKQK